jgi:hypothetical protein
MRNRTWSDVVMATMIGLCFAIVAEQQRQTPVIPAATAETAATEANVGDAARSLAIVALLGNDRADADSERAPLASTASATDRAMAKAAAAAGHVARDIEMPFFSFGGDASAE